MKYHRSSINLPPNADRPITEATTEVILDFVIFFDNSYTPMAKRTYNINGADQKIAYTSCRFSRVDTEATNDSIIGKYAVESKIVSCPDLSKDDIPMK